jgi:hypothetical protein
MPPKSSMRSVLTIMAPVKFKWFVGFSILLLAMSGLQAQTLGDVRVLCIRANFSDATLDYESDAAWLDSIKKQFDFAGPYYIRNSYGRIRSMPYDVTNVISLKNRAKDFLHAESKLAEVLKSEAKKAGWDVDAYSVVALFFPGVGGDYGALGAPGVVWMPGKDPWPPGFAHELGHAFGMGHAGTWEGGAAQWPATHDEGSDPYFTMGSGEPGSDWPLPMKHLAGWVDDKSVIDVGLGPTRVIRLYAHDTPTANAPGPVGIRAGRYWISYAPHQSHWEQEGIPSTMVTESLFLHSREGTDTYLVDTTPNSRKSADRQQSGLDPFHDAKDAPLMLNSATTLPCDDCSPSYSLTVSPVATGSSDDHAWIDVMIGMEQSMVLSLISESFAGVPGPLAGRAGGRGWASPWEINETTGKATISRSGLEYPQVSSRSGSLVLVASSNPEDQLELHRRLEGYVGIEKSVHWVAFLYKPSHMGEGDLFLGFGAQREMDFGKPWGSKLGIYGNPTDVPGEGPETRLIVAKLVFGSKTSRIFIWIDPPLDAEPSLKAAQAQQVGAFPLTREFSIRLQGHGQGEYIIDELHMAPDYATLVAMLKGGA